MKNAPRKRTPVYTPDEKAKAKIAADALVSGFTWEDHLWGGDFWAEVHEELESISEGE